MRGIRFAPGDHQISFFGRFRNLGGSAERNEWIGRLFHEKARNCKRPDGTRVLGPPSLEVGEFPRLLKQNLWAKPPCQQATVTADTVRLP
jgi:hypothetical protein